MHASCKCDNVLCSENHTISVHLAPNVSKMPVSFFWMNGWYGGEWLIARVDLSKKEPDGGEPSDSLSSTVQNLTRLYIANAQLAV